MAAAGMTGTLRSDRMGRAHSWMKEMFLGLDFGGNYVDTARHGMVLYVCIMGKYASCYT